MFNGRFTGAITALITPSAMARSMRRRWSAWSSSSGARHPRPGALRHDRRVARAHAPRSTSASSRSPCRPCARLVRAHRPHARPGDRRVGHEQHRRGDPLLAGRRARRGRWPPARHPLLQQADPGRALSPLRRRRRRDPAADHPLQRARAHRREHAARDGRAAGAGLPDDRRRSRRRAARSTRRPIVRRLCGPDFILLSGDDSMTLPTLAVGGNGIISVLSNVAPAAVAELVEAWWDGDHAEAQALHLRLFPLMRALFIETNPGPVKAAAEMLGSAPANCACRSPRWPRRPTPRLRRGAGAGRACRPCDAGGCGGMSALRLAIAGAGGRMGRQVLAAALAADPPVAIHAGFVRPGSPLAGHRSRHPGRAAARSASPPSRPSRAADTLRRCRCAGRFLARRRRRSPSPRPPQRAASPSSPARPA